MAIHRNIVRTDKVFNGEAKTFSIAVFEPIGAVLNAQGDVVTGTPKNVSGYTLSWMLKRNKTDSDLMAKITKVMPSGVVISGAFDISQALNTQRVLIMLTKTELATVLPTIVYYHELKRVDSNVETVLTYGSFALNQGVHR